MSKLGTRPKGSVLNPNRPAEPPTWLQLLVLESYLRENIPKPAGRLPERFNWCLRLSINETAMSLD